MGRRAQGGDWTLGKAVGQKSPLPFIVGIVEVPGIGIWNPKETRRKEVRLRRISDAFLSLTVGILFSHSVLWEGRRLTYQNGRDNLDSRLRLATVLSPLLRCIKEGLAHFPPLVSKVYSHQWNGMNNSYIYVGRKEEERTSSREEKELKVTNYTSKEAGFWFRIHHMLRLIKSDTLVPRLLYSFCWTNFSSSVQITIP